MLIGLNGKKQAGKDTAYERMVVRLPNATVERRSFADKLYDSAAAALGIDPAWLRELKTNDQARLVIDTPDVRVPLTFRAYLQHYGTEAHRDVFGPEFWVENVDLEHARKVVVVTDVRFPNEARAIADAGGVVVRVVGPVEVEEAGDGHASEAELPHALVDGVIYNTNRDDGFESLDRQVLDLVLSLLREERVGVSR